MVFKANLAAPAPWIAAKVGHGGYDLARPGMLAFIWGREIYHVVESDDLEMMNVTGPLLGVGGWWACLHPGTVTKGVVSAEEGILTEAIGIGNVMAMVLYANNVIGDFVFTKNTNIAKALGLSDEEWGVLAISGDGDVVYTPHCGNSCEDVPPANYGSL